MAGLSVVLEQPDKQNHPGKARIVSKSSLHHRCTNKKQLAVSSFLQRCFLCHMELAKDRDIYMYRGDRAFCSVECRSRQIFMDEQDAGGVGSVRSLSGRPTGGGGFAY